eukprot:TRINITY_DN1171_c1_g1_i1.p1 TRINITY_DN1171_c1_g1~~TRINITY_DN1171_c1_g1_i1.p1  ORF type:complete len:612 (+),score=67.05 TRINITY_DN1171_c1_g1_i1:925-2760(+)
MRPQSRQHLPNLTPIVFSCPTASRQVLDQLATEFAQARAFMINRRGRTSHPSLLCHPISNFCELQSLLWSSCVMRAFCSALTSTGVVVVTQSHAEHALVSSWFDSGTTIVTSFCRDMPTGEVAYLLRAHPKLPESKHTIPQNASPRDMAVLENFCKVGLVSAANEHFVNDDYYITKVQAWSAAGHATVLERHTGVEYFALFRSGMCLLVSVGVYEATDRPCTTFYNFVHAEEPLKHTCGHDMLGIVDTEGQHVLRSMLGDIAAILGGPSMALIYAVCSGCVAGFRFAKVDLCKAEVARVGKLGDLSWVKKCAAGYDVVPFADEKIVAKAMQAAHDAEVAFDVERLLEGDNVPVELLLSYDVAKAVCSIPHQRAMNRLRYAALLSRRDLLIPTNLDARYDKVEATSIIHSLDAEGRVVGHKWLVRVIVLLSICGAAVAAYFVSRDDNVNSAEVLGTALAVGSVLLITLPQIFVEAIGTGYSIGELYRGCLPMTVVMKRRDVAFLKECLREGADVERVISGRHGCFLLGRARGSLDIGPAKVKDLDDRWDYGLNDRGVLCLRYGGLVGDMQVRERTIEGKLCRWWHCAVVGNKIVKGVSKAELLKYLGEGEIG